jgi:glyoxylase-like metal-dependent hydrolase (beta-lactamase superfamily II)
MRALRNLFALVVIVVVLGGGALVAFRIARQKPSSPEEIKPSLVAVSSAGSYLYAARVGQHVVLFDTGADPAGNPVDNALAGLHAGRGDVSDIFLTHAHGDHTAGASGLPGAHVHLGQADVPFAEGRAPWDSLLLRVMSKGMGAPSINVSSPLDAVQVVDLGGGKLVKAIPVPGHTPGSYVFLYDDVLFTRDTAIFKQGRLDRGPGLFDSNSEQVKASVTALKQQLAGAEIAAVCTGHGGCTPLGLGRTLFDDFVGRVGG